jgi:hypothetical protein
MSADVMILVDAPVMMVPDTIPELETASEDVLSPSPGSAAGRTGAGARAGVLLRDGARLGPGSNRVFVTLMSGRAIVSCWD